VNARRNSIGTVTYPTLNSCLFLTCILYNPLTRGTVTRSSSKLSGKSTVQYMHRTLKDFISTPDVRAFIMSGSEKDVNPTACLCRSFILQLTTLSPASPSVSDGQFWDKILRGLESALKVGEKSLDSHIWLLDTLDQAAKSVSRAHGVPGITLLDKYKLSDSSHWSMILTKRPEGVDFLPFAVRCHLNQYVKSKLKAHHRTDIKVHTKLLHVAVSSSGVPFLYRRGAIPEVSLVQTLPEGHANPNQGIDGFSSWQFVVQSIEKTGEASWQPICEAFEEYSVELLPTYSKALALVHRKRGRTHPNRGGRRFRLPCRQGCTTSVLMRTPIRFITVRSLQEKELIEMSEGRSLSTEISGFILWMRSTRTRNCHFHQLRLYPRPSPMRSART
jgi:hypothetical protein